ncbi:GIY-YIG nuclease family protein [Microcoleus sp. FACHB-SPT15]|uniref:GIY-YIG nuclease family protein n=1 Tax=Microcoleus sp. FACHB-SPT15 TaxID=2692830 RepID=UPI00177DA892|nr:GIY-YIG nuclease family protein [Microcoleus sp. FACHB-SPT15]MBD1805695.1 GIY-YIG nuclease family protein [Microcoleus sp. FACHB-SPT15]
MNLETLQQKLPHVSLTELNELPEVSAIYYVVVNETVLYIGKATNLKDRWRSHHRALQLTTFTYAAITVDIYWRECDKSALNEEESKDIKIFTPCLNRTPILKKGDKETEKETEEIPVKRRTVKIIKLDPELIEAVKASMKFRLTTKSSVLQKKVIDRVPRELTIPILECLEATWQYNIKGKSVDESVSFAVQDEKSLAKRGSISMVLFS